MKKSGFTLIELLIAISILAIAFTLASRAMIRSVTAWESYSKETTWTQQLQIGISKVSNDLLKAKLSTVVITKNTNFDSVVFQTPVQYTQTGADGLVGHKLEYTVEVINNQRALVRKLYTSAGVLVPKSKKVVAWNIDDQLDTTKTGLDAWKQKGFALLLSNNQMYIYIRVKNMRPKPGDTNRHLDLETKVFVRN